MISSDLVWVEEPDRLEFICPLCKGEVLYYGRIPENPECDTATCPNYVRR